MKKSTMLIVLTAAIATLTLSNAALAVSGAGAIALEFPVGARYNALG